MAPMGDEPTNPFQAPQESTEPSEATWGRVGRWITMAILFATGCFSVAAGIAATLASLGITEREVGMSRTKAGLIAILWALVAPIALVMATKHCMRHRK